MTPATAAGCALCRAGTPSHVAFFRDEAGRGVSFYWCSDCVCDHGAEFAEGFDCERFTLSRVPAALCGPSCDVCAAPAVAEAGGGAVAVSRFCPSHLLEALREPENAGESFRSLSREPDDDPHADEARGIMSAEVRRGAAWEPEADCPGCGLSLTEAELRRHKCPEVSR